MAAQTEIVVRQGEFYIPARAYEAFLAFVQRIMPLADRERLVIALGEQGGIWPACILPDALDVELHERFGLLPARV